MLRSLTTLATSRRRRRRRPGARLIQGHRLRPTTCLRAISRAWRVASRRGRQPSRGISASTRVASGNSGQRVSVGIAPESTHAGSQRGAELSRVGHRLGGVAADVAARGKQGTGGPWAHGDR